MDSPSHIIEKVEFFCKKRAEIQEIHANDEFLLKKKLDDFNSEFRRLYKRDAHKLMIAAFIFELKSLVHLMIDDAADYFAQVTTTEEDLNYFDVNLERLEFDSFTQEMMVQYIHCFGRWAFHSPTLTLTLNRSFQTMEIATTSYREEKTGDGAKCKRIAAIDDDDDSKEPIHNEIPRKENMKDKQIVTETDSDSDSDSYSSENMLDKQITRTDDDSSNSERGEEINFDYWEHSLLQVPFSQYKTLSSKQQREWLTAHYLLKIGGGAYLFHEKMVKTPEDEDEDDKWMFD
ncbi:uncharacterized protein [Rutidosis leptorrhynchoides]|uniref:uncharacterized protein n=1 Tax=Rutidosis leptorrhynchoides TaxID=125765 RepID=UPI003A995751